MPNFSRQTTPKQAWLKAQAQFSETRTDARNSLPVLPDEESRDTLRQGLNCLNAIERYVTELTVADSGETVVSLAVPLFQVSEATEWSLGSCNPTSSPSTTSGAVEKPELTEAFSALRDAVKNGWLSKYGEVALDPPRVLKDPLHIDDTALQSLIDCATRVAVGESQVYATSSSPGPGSIAGFMYEGVNPHALVELIVARKQLEIAEDALFHPPNDEH